jgi:adenosylcobinamide-GDP ribazoletransferase
MGALVALLIPEWLGRRLGGHTGDSYGASVVLTEAFILLVLALLAMAI